MLSTENLFVADDCVLCLAAMNQERGEHYLKCKKYLSKMDTIVYYEVFSTLETLIRTTPNIYICYF